MIFSVSGNVFQTPQFVSDVFCNEVSATLKLCPKFKISLVSVLISAEKRLFKIKLHKTQTYTDNNNNNNNNNRI